MLVLTYNVKTFEEAVIEEAKMHTLFIVANKTVKKEFKINNTIETDIIKEKEGYKLKVLIQNDFEKN